MPEGIERGERGNFGDEPDLQERPGVDREIPQHRVSVVAGCRVQLRQLHDPLAQELTGSSGNSWGPAARRPSFYVVQRAFLPLTTLVEPVQTGFSRRAS